jgi:hypothetical protein
MRVSSRAIAIAVVLAIGGSAHAQMAHRLKGFVRTTAGVPLAGATLKAQAVTGFRGDPVGSMVPEHTVTTIDTGEFNVVGIESGLWLFSTAAADHLPAVVVIPVKFSYRQQVSAVGNSLTWQLPLQAMPANLHPMLKVAHDLIKEGKTEEGFQALSVALGPDVPDDTRVAAGEMSLMLRQHAMAKTLFEMVLQKQPKHPRAKLGASSAALLAMDWEAAGKLVWDARDLVPRDLRPALAAAIDDLRGIARITK